MLSLEIAVPFDGSAVCLTAIAYAKVPIVQRPRTQPFQGCNTGSNPVGDANFSGKIPARSPVNRPVSLNQ